MYKRILAIILCCIFSSTLLYGEELEGIYLVAGAGYKSPVLDIIKLFEKSSGEKINAVFGNMKMVTTYVKQSADVSLIIGDSRFIKKSGIQLQDTLDIGTGRLLMVYQSGLNIKNINELKSAEIQRIGIPDPKKAIYGKAAVEFLKASGLYEAVKDKLLILKTVPQVSAYLKSGDIDVGLINVTDYVKLQSDKLKTLEIDQGFYNKITIQAGLINNSGQNFFKFLESTAAKKIFTEYGL